MLDNALIGYSGFVGSNIKTKFDFTKLYNSSNIEDIEYLEFDTVVCAGSYGGTSGRQTSILKKTGNLSKD
tara:strand:+ start:261 stop:470 length:210 start_codon:yes stop_codon:yes gene_type:complete